MDLTAPIFMKITVILWTSHSTEFYKNKKTGEYWKYRQNFTYAIKWSMAFSALTFTKPRAADQHEGLLDRNSPKLAKKCGVLFIKNDSLYWVTCTNACLTTFCKELLYKFHEKPTNSLVTDSTSQTARHGHNIIYFYSVKNAFKPVAMNTEAQQWKIY